MILITPREFIKATSSIKLNNFLYDSGTITDWYEYGDDVVFKGYSPTVVVWRFEKNNFSRRTNTNEGLKDFKINDGQISFTNNDNVVRNRNNILKKGYIEKGTPAKLQFRPAWNWVHTHNKEIQLISEKLMSPICLFGEWLYAKHSIEYDKLPDLFLAYDIWVVEDHNFLAPDVVESLLKETTISYIKPKKVILNSIEDIIKLAEEKSEYRNGIREGIVVKTSDGRFLKDTWKVVNKHFERRNDFNDCLIRNKVVYL